MITDPYDVGSWNFYDRQGNKTVKHYEPKKSVYGHGDYDDGYTIKYNYICDTPVILNQCPVEFNAPNLVDRDGMKIGPWAEWECDNCLSINLYDDGKKIGYQHTYRFLNDSTAYLAILTEMKDDHVSGNALVFHPETRMPYIVAKNTSPNKDFKDEADLLIGFGDADKTVQSYIYIYEENRLVSEGWMICLEDDFMKRRCYFVGDMKVYDKNGRATTLRAPMDGTKIPQFNLPIRMDVGFAE